MIKQYRCFNVRVFRVYIFRSYFFRSYFLSSPPTTVTPMQTSQQDAIQAAAFRRLLAHLDSRKDVQNIDLMNLAGFCRNCLSKWLRAAAQEQGVEMSDEQAREQVYGMPYADWKAQYQK